MRAVEEDGVCVLRNTPATGAEATLFGDEIQED